MPQAQPGQPPQQQGGLAMGQLNVGFGGGIGMPRLGVSGANFTPGALWQKAMGGQGFENARKVGAAFLGIAAAAIAANVLMVKVLHIYYRFVYGIGAVCLLVGLFMLITGQPQHKADGSPVTGGARTGFIVSIVLGFALAAFLNFYYWERWLPFLDHS